VRACLEAASTRPAQGRPKICHGGTLDPFAQGLLLILAGPATKLFDHLHAVPKVYHATLCWGIETDNGDPLGRTTFTGDASDLTAEKLDQALAGFVGWQEQIPPATSGKRIGGERAYIKAHRGETVVLPPARVYLHEARWLRHDLPRESELEIVVRGGYYVRALVRDVGRLLGSGAHLTTLQRTAIGPWNDPGPGRTIDVHGRDLLPWAPLRLLTDQELADLRQGKIISREELLPPDWSPPPGFPDPAAPIRGMHLGKLVFLLEPREEGLAVRAEFPGGI
jgi:tRNA pseudouridine55 synthase